MATPTAPSRTPAPGSSARPPAADHRLPATGHRLPAAGHQVRAETIAQEALRGSLRSAGLGDKQIEGLAGMSAVMCEDFAAEDKRSIVTTTPTTLAAWAHACLRPALVQGGVRGHP
jgi:hypothetical protein